MKSLVIHHTVVILGKEKITRPLHPPGIQVFCIGIRILCTMKLMTVWSSCQRQLFKHSKQPTTQHSSVRFQTNITSQKSKDDGVQTSNLHLLQSKKITCSNTDISKLNPLSECVLKNVNTENKEETSLYVNFTQW